MKIKLVFHDWIGNGSYSELSLGDFHSGSTFDAEIKLTEDQEKEITEAIKNKSYPVFWVTK